MTAAVTDVRPAQPAAPVRTSTGGAAPAPLAPATTDTGAAAAPPTRAAAPPALLLVEALASDDGVPPKTLVAGERIGLRLLAARLPTAVTFEAGQLLRGAFAGTTEPGEPLFATPLGVLVARGESAAFAGKIIALTPAFDDNAAPPSVTAEVVDGPSPNPRPGDAAALRLLAPATVAQSQPSPGQVFDALVVRGEPAALLATPLGLMRLPRGWRTASEPLLLEIVDLSPSIPALARFGAGTAALAELGQRWPKLDDALRRLAARAGDPSDKRLAAAIPMPGPELLQRVVRYIRALREGDFAQWLADSDDIARDGALAPVAHDFARLSRLAEPGQEWATFLIPILDGRHLQQVRLFVREDAPSNAAADVEPAARFLLEVDLSRIGAVQFEGMCRRRHLNLAVRSARRLPRSVADEATRIFYESLGALGLSGDIRIEQGGRFSTAPLAAIEPIPTRIDA